MPALADLQAEMALALIAGHCDGLAPEVAPGPVRASEALAVYRNTALHGLVNALRLSFPTVDDLTGEDFFDQAALAFVAGQPPRSAWLTGYGAGFPDFLESYEFAAGHPYLADVARLDLVIEETGHEALGRDGRQVDLGETVLTLDASLRLVELQWPALAIREAVETDHDRLAGLDLRPERHVLALWRIGEGAGVRRLDPFPAAVLAALVQGADVAAVLSQGGDLSALQSQVLAAPFARLAAKAREA